MATKTGMHEGFGTRVRDMICCLLCFAVLLVVWAQLHSRCESHFSGYAGKGFGPFLVLFVLFCY